MIPVPALQGANTRCAVAKTEEQFRPTADIPLEHVQRLLFVTDGAFIAAPGLFTSDLNSIVILDFHTGNANA